MKTLNPLATEHKNQLETNAPFIFMFEIETKDEPPLRLRLCQFDKIVEFGENSSGEAIKYYPAPMSIGSVSQNANGDLPTLDVSIAIAGPLTIHDIDLNDGYTDQPCRIVLVSSLDMGSAAVPILDEEAQIVGTEFSSEVVKFTVAGSDLFQSKFPHIVYSRTSCPHVFGGALCGYNLNAEGAQFTQCGVMNGDISVFRPFSLEACTAVGDEEETNANATKRHPKRWGGERGIPRG